MEQPLPEGLSGVLYCSYDSHAHLLHPSEELHTTVTLTHRQQVSLKPNPNP